MVRHTRLNFKPLKVGARLMVDGYAIGLCN